MAPPPAAARPFDVGVIGATGLSGRPLAEALRDRGLRVLLGGRSPARLEEVARRTGIPDTRVVDLHDDAGVASFLGDARLVVNAAGPYGAHGERVVEAAIAAGTHYLDLAAEQTHVRACYGLHERAEAAGVVVAPAIGIEVAVSDCAAALAAAGLDRIDRVEVGMTAIALWPSRGSAWSALCILAGPTWEHTGGALRPSVPGHLTRDIPFTAPFGTRGCVSLAGAEAFTMPRHLPVATVRVQYGPPRPTATIAGAVLPAVARLARRPRARSWIEARARASVSDPAVKDDSQFQVYVSVRGAVGGREVVRETWVSGRNAYRSTARIAAAFAEAVLHGRSPGGPGAQPPARAIAPAALFAAVAPFGIERHTSEEVLSA